MGARGHGAARSPSPAGRGHPWVLQRLYKPRNARTGGSQPGPLHLFFHQGLLEHGRRPGEMDAPWPGPLRRGERSRLMGCGSARHRSRGVRGHRAVAGSKRPHLSAGGPGASRQREGMLGTGCPVLGAAGPAGRKVLLVKVRQGEARAAGAWLEEGTGSPRLSLGCWHLRPVPATGERGQGAGRAPIAATGPGPEPGRAS